MTDDGDLPADEDESPEMLSIDYAPSHDIHFTLDFAHAPDGVRRLFDELGHAAADFIAMLREGPREEDDE